MTAVELATSLGEVAQAGDDQSQALAEFTHRTIDDLCGRVVNFSKEYKTVKRAYDVAQALQSCIRKKFSKKLSESDFTGLLTEQHKVPSAVAKLISSAVTTRQDEIKKQLIEHLVNISTSHMTDFDWSLRLTMATSHLSYVRIHVNRNKHKICVNLHMYVLFL